MDLENIVIFKGGRDGINVILDEYASFKDIKTIFIQKLQDAKSFFSGAKVNIRFKGKILTQDQQKELIELLSGQNILNISFIHDFETDDDEKQTSKTTKQIVEEAEKWYTSESSYDASMTKYHIGMLRSGQSIDYKGSVVVVGDVNPGAKISAGGSVIILGNLKGIVHAGKDPKSYKPFVTAIGMYPVQIGIGALIARSPDAVYGQEIEQKDSMFIAYLNSQQIYIEPVDQKTIANIINQ